jgi:pilus assembly protein FimV
MTRKLALLLLLGAGVCDPAFGLGLGEIEVESALNQRFEATIRLLNTDGLEDGEILPNLASSEDFERVGVERFFYLLDLEFTTDLSDPANPVIRVTSERPVREPFVNFLVEVLWPSGRLLREYTVLLDPPEYAAQTAPAAAPAPAPAPPPEEAAARPAPPPRSPAASRGTGSAPTAAGGSAGGRGRLEGGTYGVTDRFDTLWEIALEVRPAEDVTVQQTMLALRRLNPEAFLRGNINGLKAGYVLRVPDAAEARRVSADEAVTEVSAENERWRTGLDGAPVDARPAASEGAASPAPDGELRLVSGSGDGGAGPGTTAGAGGGAGGAPVAELAAVEEELDRVRLENADLETRLEQRDERMEELQRQLELRNQELARLQERLAAQQDEPATQPDEPATQPDAPATQPDAPATQPAPRAPADDGILFGLGARTLGLLAGGFFLVLAGIALVLRRRGAGDGDFARPSGDVAADLARGESLAVAAAAGTPLEEDEGAAEESGEADGDVVSEADIYMAYGRFSEAARVLGAALEQEPGRDDVRLKLMEVHVETGDVEAFNEQARELQARADAEVLAQADQLAGRLAGALLSSGQLSDGSGVAAEGVEDDLSLDFELADDAADLDTLDIDLDLGDEEADQEATRPAAAPGAEAPEEAGAAGLEEPPVEVEEEGFELDLDLGEEEDDTPRLLRDSGEPEGGGSPADEDFALELAGDEEAPEAAEEDEFALDIDTPEGAAAALADLETPGEATAEGGELALGEELELDTDADEITTKLELARAYVDMGDDDGAREILDEVVRDGDAQQKQEAGELLARLG